MPHATSPHACAVACCSDQLCNTWQLDIGATAKGCWVGSVATGSCTAPKEGTWVGGQRDSPPPYRNATLVGLSANATAGATKRPTRVA